LTVFPLFASLASAIGSRLLTAHCRSQTNFFPRIGHICRVCFSDGNAGQSHRRRRDWQTPGVAHGDAWCHLFLFGPTHRQSRIHFGSEAPKLGIAGTGASARLAAIVQAIMIAQLILRVEVIPIL
jgi:hypothetical protein